MNAADSSVMVTPSNCETAPGIDSLWDQYFEIIPAITPELLDEVFALRYEVYCVEHRFEDPADHPSGRESDGWDVFARHIALRYRPSGEVIGTGRLILPAESRGDLPLVSLLGPDLQAQLREYPSGHLGEISRYVVSKSFRRRRGESEFPDVGHPSPDAGDGRRLMPRLTLALIGGLLQLGVSLNVRYFCACMRPALLRLLKHLGFEFKPLGPLVDYHGLRQPCVAPVADLLLGLRRQGPQLQSH